MLIVFRKYGEKISLGFWEMKCILGSSEITHMIAIIKFSNFLNKMWFVFMSQNAFRYLLFVFIFLAKSLNRGVSVKFFW